MLKRQRGSLLMYSLLALAILSAIYLVFQWVDNHWETDAGVRKGKAECKADWDKAIKDQKEKEEAKASAAVKTLGDKDAKAKVVYREITKTIDKYIDRPVYRNICFDDDGLRDANRALNGESAVTGKPSAVVPKTGASK